MLFLIERIPDGDGVLLQHQFVEQRQVSRIIPHTVFYQQDRPYPFFQDIVFGIEPVLYQLDDGDDQVSGVIPVKEIVHIGLILLLNTPVHLFAERRQQHNRTGRQHLLGLLRKLPHIVSSGTIDHDDQIKPFAIRPYPFQRLLRRLGTGDRRRIAQIQLRILLGDLHVDAAVFLQCKTVIVIAYQQDPPDTFRHQRCVVAIIHYTKPCSTMELATFIKPAMLAPLT